MTLLTPTLAQTQGGVMTGATFSALVSDLTTVQNAFSPVAIPNLDPQTIQYQTVALTLAQVLALYTTPVQLVAAQGPGTFIEVVSVVVNLIYGSAAYSGGGAVGACYGPALTYPAAASIAASVFTGLTGNSLVRSSPLGATIVDPSSGALNAGLYLTCATAVFTGGAGCSLIVKISYRVVGGLS